jgi:septal ring factor EnvC (AmiA/AmiB activator)
MTCGIVTSLARNAALVALVFGGCLSTVFAEQEEQKPDNIYEHESVSRPAGEPLTDFAIMELHLRRYSAAANNMAQLFRQLNQKIQEVSVAAKTVEAKNSFHNRRVLEEKLRHLENTRALLNVQHSQLQSQMQNEYRNYAASSTDLRTKYDGLQELHNEIEAARAAKEAKDTKDEKPKPAKGKQKANEPQGTEMKETGAGQETRAGKPGTHPGPTSHAGSTPGTAAHAVR